LRRATIAAARTASRRAARRGSIARGAASAARCLATRASALRFTSSIERAAAGQLQTGASSAAHDERQQEAGGTERPCRATTGERAERGRNGNSAYPNGAQPALSAQRIVRGPTSRSAA